MKRQPWPVSHHFDNVCPDMDYLKITPLEHIKLETEQGVRDLDSSDTLSRWRYCFDTKSEWVSMLKCEQKWIKKIKSKIPYGMNKCRDLPSPIISPSVYNLWIKHLQLKIL